METFDIFNVLTMLGGIALFLFGMSVLGEGLEKQAGGRFKSVLERMTSKPIKGLLIGTGVTAVIQSSAATTVMVIGFVNSGIMRLGQAIGVIMGANIGTTATSWILSLIGLKGDSLVINLLKPSAFSPVLGFIGIVLFMSAKKGRRHDIGTLLIGFSVLMFGINTMSDAVEPLADVPEFTNILLMFSNPILGVVVGALLTAIIQSSSASVGILQALSTTGAISYGNAIPIILGMNIGKCITPMISSIGANKNARRVAIVHLYFNLIGVILFLSVYYCIKFTVGISMIDDSASAVGIAIIHTFFNLATTVVLLPCTKLLEKLAMWTIKASKDDEEFALLDDRLLLTPSFAIDRCRQLSFSMCCTARDALSKAIEQMTEFSPDGVKLVYDLENKTDMYEDKLGTYLVKLSSSNLTEKDNHEVSKFMHCLGDLERIGDHALNIVQVAEEMHEKSLEFSDTAKAELSIAYEAINEIVDKTITAFMSDDISLAKEVEPLEDIIDILKEELRSRHIERLRRGQCTNELGFVLSDLLTNCERAADHCSNIATCVIQVRYDHFDQHEYHMDLKNGTDNQYNTCYEEYMKKYALPQK